MRTLLRIFALAGVVIAVSSTVVASASAQAPEGQEASNTEKAAQLKRQGNEAMERGRPADALAMYRAAYEAEPDAALLYNMGRAYQALADYPQALEYLTRFDKEASPKLKERVPNLAALIAEVQARVTTVTIVVNVDGATVRLGNRRLGKTPLEAPVQVNAGKFTLEVNSDQHLPYEQEVDLAGGKTVTLNVALDSKETHGFLAVRSPEPGVSVWVDGKLRGMVPLELRVRAGQRRIELRKEGFGTVTTSAVVEAGKRKEVTIQIEDEPALYEKWWFWTSIGVVAAGTVTAVIIHGKEKEADVGTIPPGQISAGLRF